MSLDLWSRSRSRKNYAALVPALEYKKAQGNGSFITFL